MVSAGLVQLSMVLLLSGSVGGTANAECVGMPVESYIKHSDLVFRGVVTEAQRHESHIVMTFQVSRVWKGKMGRSIVLHQVLGMERATWPEDLIGREYVILASRLSEYERNVIGAKTIEVFGIPQCMNAISIDHAAEYLKKLGRGRAPE